ncbi:hypothetical protein [Nonomuraea sp. NPDC049646]|uniref:hypothetical protein n=1 Tax=Nonomuraea sp. NPDC049646 TaxID=3364354 RepID=UPI0037A5A8AA
MQLPGFGGRFWGYQAVDRRTDTFAEPGAMYGNHLGPDLHDAAWACCEGTAGRNEFR